VIGVDDFALRRRHCYATIIIDAETGQRVAVLPGRDAATLESWLREHPGRGRVPGWLGHLRRGHPPCPAGRGAGQRSMAPLAKRPKDTTLLDKIAAACPEMTALTDLVDGFAALLTPTAGNDAKLTEWITAVRAVGLPHLRSLTNGLEIDRAAVNAGLTLPHHNGRTEGVNTRTKRIMRQMHGRAGFDLLRHRILLQ
jgi:hypothetical protein